MGFMRYISSVTYNCFFFFFIFFFVTLMMMITASEALIQKSAGSLATTVPPAGHIYYYNETSDDHDLLSLLALKDQLVGAPVDGGSSNVLSSWNINHSSHLHFCQWPGVHCGRRHKNRVVALDLPNAGLAGTISPHIGNLSFLSSIKFGNNSLHGQIPAEMGRLRRLKFLSWYNNSLTGEIPANLSYCSKLEGIDFYMNNFEGNIPFQLGYLPNLKGLGLASNELAGSIPTSLGNLTNLEVLYLAENSLSGSIPKELGQLSRLEELFLSLNPLSGVIPPSLFNLSSLIDLELYSNNLHGNLPPALGLTTALPNINYFNVNSNFLTGHIPPSLSNLSSLEDLDLGQNSFTGPIPSNLGRLQSLKKFGIFQNKLQAKDGDLSFLTQLITNCSLLESLEVSENRLTGWLPPDSNLLTNFSSNLRELYLGYNPIRGNLPKWILNLENLEILYLGKMYLTGEMPSEFGKLTKIKVINLARNRFSGVIPPSIGNITGLIYLLLNENGFKGHIPSSVGNFRQLPELNLSHNALTGPIPKQVFSISSLSISLDLSYNALSGIIPMEVGNLQNLGRLDISNNHLSGEMPSTLSNCLGLEHLSISGNFINGTIPSSLRTLRGIVTLGLDRNNLSGEIPDYLGDFAFLSYLNLSFNNLQGKVPENGIFKNASAFSVVGNGKLCGGIKELHLPACSSTTTHPLNNKSRGINLHHLTKILIVTGVIVSLVPFILLMFSCWRRRTSRKKSGIPSSYKDHDYDLLIRSVGYKELLNATNGFSPSNLIGQGSFGYVYRGVLLDHRQNDDNDNDEEEERRVVINVAVKVLNLQNSGASKSFMAECEALRSIRHRNLVKIITVCSSIDYNGNDFKALVFAYLPNGSLERWLYPKQLDHGPTSSDHQLIRRNLTLKERLNIAIDVASELEYLHHHSETPIVHRDLKPSNILLDGDMNAYVGDFGIARVLLLDTTTRSRTTTSIKGTIGYIAPEYGLDEKVSTQGDVYSYGVLLLELFTGKRPTEEMFSDALSLHQFVKEALLEHPICLEKIVDLVLLMQFPQFPSTIGESSSAASNTATSPCRTPPNDNSRYNTVSCLLSVLRIGVHCSEELPNKRMEMNHVVSKMHSIRDKYLIGTAVHRNMQM